MIECVPLFPDVWQTRRAMNISGLLYMCACAVVLRHGRSARWQRVQLVFFVGANVESWCPNPFVPWSWLNSNVAADLNENLFGCLGWLDVQVGEVELCQTRTTNRSGGCYQFLWVCCSTVVCLDDFFFIKYMQPTDDRSYGAQHAKLMDSSCVHYFFSSPVFLLSMFYLSFFLSLAWHIHKYTFYTYMYVKPNIRVCPVSIVFVLFCKLLMHHQTFIVNTCSV